VDTRGELGEADSNKNAIVSGKSKLFQIWPHADKVVMLRALEYFSGILIMTTNRVMSLDFAIISRINFAINFGDLTTLQQKQIWFNWHRKLNSRNCENTADVKKWIEALLKRKQTSLNGREIRNVFTTAQTLAVDNNNKITTDHLEKVINSMAAFQGEMSKKLERARGQSTALKLR
jgi:AAA+ superfamily predicted ATPase